MKEGEGICNIGKLVVQMHWLRKRCYSNRGSLAMTFDGAGHVGLVNIIDTVIRMVANT